MSGGVDGLVRDKRPDEDSSPLKSSFQRSTCCDSSVLQRPRRTAAAGSLNKTHKLLQQCKPGHQLTKNF